MMSKYEHIESVYWVFTQLCNDICDHCYNCSGPQGNRMSEEECFAIIDNLPEKVDRLILSGGEPLSEKKKLYSILDRLQEIQLLTAEDKASLLHILDALVAKNKVKSIANNFN